MNNISNNMTDEQLQIILDAFTLNGNDFELSTESFHIVSDHNFFRVSFFINDKFLIYRTKGENEKIQVDKRLDIEKLLNEIKIETEIINLLKEVELFDYYKSKDVDKEENKPSIFLIDRKVLLDDVNYIFNNQNEYVDKDSIHYDDELEFIEKIKQLQNKLK